MKGRKPKPTRLKQLAGTDQPCRILKNEMSVATLAEVPNPPMELSDRGLLVWEIVGAELKAKKMLHLVDLALLAAYANEIALYQQAENTLRTGGRVDEFYNEEGQLTRRQAKPEQKIAKDALAAALKLAVQFGLTPSARTRINAPDLGPEPLKI